jgi:hypothetical protein
MPPVLVGASRFSFAVHISLSLSLSRERDACPLCTSDRGTASRARVGPE